MRNVSTDNSNPLLLKNYYYRYMIHSVEDLNKFTFERRLQKARQNTTTCILFDLTQWAPPTSLRLADFILKHEFNNLFLVRPDQINLLQSLEPHANFIFNLNGDRDIQSYFHQSKHLRPEGFILSPKTTDDLKSLYEFEGTQSILPIYWDFSPYNPQFKRSLSLKNIFSANRSFRRLPGTELWNARISTHYELEPIVQPCWEFKTPQRNIHLSFIIPSFNNVHFLSNVIKHLVKQNLPAENFEIIVVEDGGQDHSAEIIFELFETLKNKINLKMIYWSKTHPERGEQNFFRAGLARNLASQFAESECLFFLDSDMITPPHFAKEALNHLQNFDFIQFERHHIHQKWSALNPDYEKIQLRQQTYIEESNYWSTLFKAPRWMDLSHHWKYTCTYALGLKKKDFLEVGRFKKYYVSYGFEDTDLGYELNLRNKTCHLVQTPLLHLTSYNHMQYKNSQLQRHNLLQKTASLFYLQHLDPEIYKLFGNFYRLEKPLIKSVSDLIF